jgi:DNA-binding protein H-NS
MSKLNELIAQKEIIETQIAEVVKTERKEAIQTVKLLMLQFTITPDELTKLTAVKVVNKVAPKWQDPVSGKQWTGRGRSPAFVVAAKANGTLESMAI